MKIKAIFLSFLPFLILAQESNKTTSIINEIDISINRSMLRGENFKNKIGAGVGIYHIHFERKRINMIVGVEYNWSGIMIKTIMDGSHYSFKENVNYNLHKFSFPIGIQTNIGEKIRFIFQLGGFLDVPFLSYARGFETLYYPIPEDKPKLFETKRVMKGVDLGVYGGMGVLIPISKHNVIIKLIYKFGMMQVDNNFYDRTLKLVLGYKFK